MAKETLYFLRPVEAKWPVSCEFGHVTPGLRDDKPHKGVDFACPVGTPAHACFNGHVLFVRTAEDGNGAGNRIAIVDTSAKPPVKALYMHLSEFKVKTGDEVIKGETVGLTGNSGASTGPHLHFETRSLLTEISFKPEFEPC